MNRPLVPLDSRGLAVSPPRIPKSPPPVITASPLIGRLKAELKSAEDPAAVTERFWAYVEQVGAPLVERPWPQRPDERAVTFLWRDRHGTAAGTGSVILLANKLTDPSVLSSSMFERIAGTDIWHRSYRLPSAWHGSYQLAADDCDRPEPRTADSGPHLRWRGAAQRALPDPFCKRQLAGLNGQRPLSVVALDRAPLKDWQRRHPTVGRARIEQRTVDSVLLGEPRRIWTALPANSETVMAQALLVILDGEDWLKRLDLPVILDNLTAERLIVPTAAVMVDAIDIRQRWRELTCDTTFGRFMTEELLPWAATELPLAATAPRVISGRSLGGLTALHLAAQAAGAFDAVHAQSPSLWWPTEPTAEYPNDWLIDRLRSAPSLPAKIALDVGRDEWILLDATRRAAAALSARDDVTVTFGEYEGGHDPYCWQAAIARALPVLLAPPQRTAT